jgi:nucleotide-binding universal stress UspA family protein
MFEPVYNYLYTVKKILVPTDFSEQAGFALDFAYQIALKSTAEIILINVVDYPGLSTMWSGGMNVIGGAEPPLDNLDESFINNLLNRSKDEINSMVRKISHGNVKISQLVEVGNPYFVITERIEQENINLVIMGTKGATGLEEVLIGSNTERVVRHAKCPVITIKKKRDFTKIHNIAFASNFEGDQTHVVEELFKLQNIFNAKLHLVKINTPNNFESNRNILKGMKDFVKKYKITNYSLNIFNDFIEEDGIIYFSEDIEADMIALATHGRTGFMHLLSGSIAEDIVNHAKRPVWTCRLKI